MRITIEQLGAEPFLQPLHVPADRRLVGAEPLARGEKTAAARDGQNVLNVVPALEVIASEVDHGGFHFDAPMRAYRVLHSCRSIMP